MQRNTTKHPKAQHATTRREATRHRAAHHGAARRNTARPSRAHHNTARTDTTQHVKPQHDAARRTTAHHNTKQGTLTEGLTKSSHCTPRKEPHQPAAHQQRATARPATTVAVHPHKLPPEGYNQHRGDERTRLTQGHTKPPGTAAHQAEPEPSLTGGGAEPSLYTTHTTHGAGAQPGKTQPPTAIRKATQNADKCVHQPREGRGRDRQTPPRRENRRGGTRTAKSHHNAHQHHNRRPNPPPRRHRRWDPTKRVRGDHPAKTCNTKPRAAAHREKGHPKHADTHIVERNTNKQQTTRPGREGMGGQRTRDPTPGQRATNTTKPPAKKKPKGRGGANPTTSNTRAPPGKAGNKRGAHTNKHTPEHTSQEWRGAAAAQAQPHPSAPHPQPGSAGGHAGRAHKHTHTTHFMSVYFFSQLHLFPRLPRDARQPGLECTTRGDEENLKESVKSNSNSHYSIIQPDDQQPTNLEYEYDKLFSEVENIASSVPLESTASPVAEPERRRITLPFFPVTLLNMLVFFSTLICQILCRLCLPCPKAWDQRSRPPRKRKRHCPRRKIKRVPLAEFR